MARQYTYRHYKIAGLLDELPPPAGASQPNPELAALLAFAKEHPGKWVKVETDTNASGLACSIAGKRAFKVVQRQGVPYVSYQPSSNGNGTHAEG